MTIKYLLSNLTVYIICIFAWSGLRAQDNLTIIDSLISDYVNEEMGNPLFESGDSVSIFIPDSVSNLMRYTGSKIAYDLQQGGLQTFRNKTISGHIIDLLNVNVSIRYGEPYSSGLFGADRCKRDIVLKITGQIREEPSGQMIKSISKVKSFSDEIFYNNIEELETSSYSFTQGERRKYSAWDRIIEPALIVTSAVIIVLLFFTQRA